MGNQGGRDVYGAGANTGGELKKFLGGILGVYLALLVAARMTRNRPLLALPVIAALFLFVYASMALILVGVCRGIYIAVRFIVRKVKESRERKRNAELLAV